MRVSTWWRGAFSGAQALLTSGADLIAGLAAAMHEAERARDMRKYPFWARTRTYMETVLIPAPRKILRDSPAALPRAQIIRTKNTLRLVFGTVHFYLHTDVKHCLPARLMQH